MQAINSYPVHTDYTADDAAIKHLLKEIVEALNKGDLEKLLSFHSDDIVLMEHNMPVIEGKQKVREMFSHFQQKKWKHTIAYRIHEHEIHGNWAFCRGSVLITKSEENRHPTRTNGKFISLFKKQPTGEWLRTHVIVNSDEPVTG